MRADEISCRENCYCSTQGLKHFNWLITVCGSLTRFKNLRFCGKLVRVLSFENNLFLENSDKVKVLNLL